ncbi:MAG: excinuclease ABC subunit UvrA [Planctomycetes bacterium]|nr:excinuclease ABC subunit UvrA [Planctomycetota bacterium]MCW8136959.1 excinuclease ABC subunit UvrA [Planctomycetota bacterium]
MGLTHITVRGAHEHNLKHIDVALPRDRLVVVTGLSGSGKSSLAFDTIYAEGQRRYVESLSAYARQFLGRMQKPAVESIEGLPPTIAIEQRQAGSSPRSTVATTTEIYDYLRLLFARIGTPHCPVCNREVTRQSAEQMVDTVMQWPKGTKLMVLAPVVRGRKGEHRDVFQKVMRDGFVRARLNSEVIEVGPKTQAADKNKKHDIDVVIDRIVIEDDSRSRLNEAVEVALQLADGLVIVSREDGGKWADTSFNAKMFCPDHPDAQMGELEPRLFSFNAPQGACPQCHGLGIHTELDPALVVPDENKTLMESAIQGWNKPHEGFWYKRALKKHCPRLGINVNSPWRKLTDAQKHVLLYGEQGTDGRWGWRGKRGFPGVIPDLLHRFNKSDSDSVKQWVMKFMAERECPTCHGSRLNPFASAVDVGGKRIHQIACMNVAAAREWISNVKLSREKAHIAHEVIREISARLGFMVDVGIGYLTLDRKSGTLSGGEAQRIRLATQVGSGLVGVCYVLDEPSIGLHQRDNDLLLGTLKNLRDIGNTVIVVEHDEDTIRSADYLVDLGPGAGEHGGRVIYAGDAAGIAKADTLTADYITGRKQVPVPAQTRAMSTTKAITVRGAAENNLKKIDVAFPLGGLVCVTGVSGSGKSTLVTDILARALAKELHHAQTEPGKHVRIDGLQQIDKVIEIDQSPIGRTPRSNPATYTDLFGPIRDLFCKSTDARARGYKPGRFSFNVPGGRCEVCEGQGVKLIEMHFLPDVYVTCEACDGRRYNRETLEVRYRGKSIADVLDMTIEEADSFFENHPKIHRIVRTLHDVGLGYVRLGQPSTQLSGGEAQRVKLATELARPDTGHTLYILDEPTTGLHFHDVARLITVLQRLVDKGNTAIVIEHNLDVIKCADWIIDLGPEGGEAGGQLIAQGPPQEVAQAKGSYTGHFLKRYFKGNKSPERKRREPARKRAKAAVGK